MQDPRFDSPLRRGFYYLRGPAGERWVKRPCGFPARVEVVDASGAGLSRATLLRAAAAAGTALEAIGDGVARPVRVILGPAGTPGGIAFGADGVEEIALDGPAVATAASCWEVDEAARALLASGAGASGAWPVNEALPASPARRALFFESLMNTAADHNDQELSQGVLHMVSALAGTGTTPTLARVKMTIHEQFRLDGGEIAPLIGLDDLPRALAGEPIELVCVTVLEGYFERVVRLIETLRALGCRAHIAVGGVMPTLTPEHVAAHLPDVSFVCRGAGEYFLPALCRILGAGASIDRPFTAAQRASLARMDGLIAVDPAGARVIVGNSARAVSVESLDAVELDLSWLRADHLVHGIEISTSRGCIHRCSFCTIVGQMTWQGRSADGIFALLDRYHRRFREIFGEAIPGKVYRVHISDDDFACDRERAIDFFRRLPDTPFRLASCQVSIADLCVHRGSVPLPVPDEELLDAIRPECFFDSRRAIGAREHIEDHGERRWSAHLQMGVESFDDAELRRHAKGYRLEHIRVIVAAAAARGIHLDAYFILSNVATTAEELIGGLMEASRLKLRHPVHFHVKYPLTPRLVSIFPSASYRRHQRAGTLDSLVVRHDGRAEGHAELDYPFIGHDVPADVWVDYAVDKPFFTHDARYAASLAGLGDVFKERLATVDDAGRRRGEALVRATDDAARHLVFELLAERGVRPGAAQEDDAGAREAVATAVELLGPGAGWVAAYRRFLSDEPLIVEIEDADLLDDALALAASSRRKGRVVRIVARDVAAVAAARGAVAALSAEDRQGVVVEVAGVALESPGEVSGAVALAATLRGAGADVILARPDGAWSAEAQAALSRALPAIDEAGARLAPVAALPSVRLGAGGEITAAGAAIGRLGDLTNVDRLLYDARAARATAAERLVASYQRWAAARKPTVRSSAPMTT